MTNGGGAEEPRAFAIGDNNGSMYSCYNLSHFLVYFLNMIVVNNIFLMELKNNLT
jgi:hypothetical protein